jgi:hypothetical protein
MKRYLITNPLTNMKYEITSDDLNRKSKTISEWILEKRDSYSLNPEIEEIDMREEIQKERISRLWKAAHDYAMEQVDVDARGKYSIILFDSSTSEDVKSKIKHIYYFMDSIWAEYYNRKKQILEGNLSVSEDFSILGDVPYNFWEIVLQ